MATAGHIPLTLASQAGDGSKSGVGSSFRAKSTVEIRCQFDSSGKNDKPTPDFF